MSLLDAVFASALWWFNAVPTRSSGSSMSTSNGRSGCTSALQWRAMWYTAWSMSTSNGRMGMLVYHLRAVGYAKV